MDTKASKHLAPSRVQNTDFFLFVKYPHLKYFSSLLNKSSTCVSEQQEQERMLSK